MNLEKIASLAGVSRMSVSRALRNQPGVSEETRAKILAVAEQIGYKPNPLVSALMSHVATSRPVKNRPVIVYLYTNSRKRDLRELMYGIEGVSSYLGAKKRAAQQGYDVQMWQMGHAGMTAERFSAILEARGIAGLIVAPMGDPSINMHLNWNAFSAVAIGYSMNHPELHRVCLDYYNGMYKALESLWRMGFRRFGFYLHTSIDQRIRHLWTSAFLTFHWVKGVSSEGRVQTPDHISHSDFLLWFKHNQPEVLFSLHEEDLRQSLGDAVQASGKQCYFFHLTLEFATSSFVAGGFPGCKLELGATAVDLVIAQIKRGEKGVPTVPQLSLIEPQFEFRMSAPCRSVTGNVLNHLPSVSKER